MSKSMIICVDDEKVVLTSLKAQLRRSFGTEIAIETAESAEEALTIVDDAQENNFDLPVIISDQIMPGMKGDEFLAIMHEKSERTLSILLTGQADADAVGRALNNAKLYRYISKPWEETDLILTIKEALRRYFQELTIEEQKTELEKYVIQLKEYNESLEQKITERTQEIQKQHDILAKQKQNITDSIDYASVIQKALLPSLDILKSVFPESFVLLNPRDIVSGDFYWMSKTKTHIFVAAADCTGHGVPGAFMSVLGMTLLNEIVERNGISRPDLVLTELRKYIKNSLNQSNDSGKPQDGMDIAFCSINLESGILQFAGAYNPLYLFKKSLKNKPEATKKEIEPEQVPGDSLISIYNANMMPISIHPKDDKTFIFHEIQLEPGDTFYIFSDGYISQFGGTRRETYKTKRFQELLLSIQDKSMQNQRQILNDTIVEWQGNNQQVDDMLVIGIKVK